MVRIPGFHPGGPGSTPGMGRNFIFAPIVSEAFTRQRTWRPEPPRTARGPQPWRAAAPASVKRRVGVRTELPAGQRAPGHVCQHGAAAVCTPRRDPNARAVGRDRRRCAENPLRCIENATLVCRTSLHCIPSYVNSPSQSEGKFRRKAKPA